MKVTVCELPDDSDRMGAAWEELTAHVGAAGSALVLLPEMPFYPWVAATDRIDEAEWQSAVQSHERWTQRFAELAPTAVLGSQPVLSDGQRFNEGFVWEPDLGYSGVHRKYYLPDEGGFWEASWYQRGELQFRPAAAAAATVGFAICTELWFTEHARGYARDGVHLLACPRATERTTVDKWIAGGRAAAVMSGAYCISSNRAGRGSGIEWGGSGWIVEPDGELLGTTSPDQPFLTLELDLDRAERAKRSYPRNVRE